MLALCDRVKPQNYVKLAEVEGANRKGEDVCFVVDLMT